MAEIQKADYRVGNFIYRVGEAHVTVMDVADGIMHRVPRHTAKGMLLEILISEGQEEHLRAYAAVVHNVLGCVFDPELLSVVNEAVIACVQRHPDVYGGPVSEEGQREELDRVRTTVEDTADLLNEAQEVSE